MTKSIDPILVTVIQHRLKAITEEMGLVMLRTARSPILSEARDFVTGLYDARGELMEQTAYIPILAFAVPLSIKYMVEYYGDELYPGDVIIHNDPYTGGNQPADVKIVRPIFVDDQLVGFSAINGHQADVGGAVAGAYNPGATEIWQESLRITPVKLYEKGVKRRDVWDLIFGNIRFPIVEEDIQAAMGGCAVGERELIKLVKRHGHDRFRAHLEHLYDATEQQMRAEISAMPDGVYHGQATAYYDGINPGSEMVIKVAVTIEGDEINFDFTGTAPQTPGFVNAPLGSSMTSVILSLLMCLKDPDLPQNEGMSRPIKMHMPLGSMVNPEFPAASTFGNHLSDQISAAIFNAMAGAVPDRVTAPWNPLFAIAAIGFNERINQPFVDILFNGLKGGGGAMQGVNGYDHIGLIACGGGLLAQDPEMFEMKDPLYIHSFEYKPDSAGAGQWRGGLGVEMKMEFLGDGNMISAFGDGVDPGSEAGGLNGGAPGTLNLGELVYGDGKTHVCTSKEMVAGIPKGTVWHQIAGGGGGYGDPLKRPAEQVAREVFYGLISPQAAHDDYGVVVDAESLAMDGPKTEALRAGRSAG
ncbi:MAG: hydantoinase B/oxoprolinase family protein [Rhodospirillales bacterium]|jgi:N-methylhydantoinase B|nr:hydantoinase B/oxoprolinase family protein [Alphaproteobacteria bacterium]MDP6843239.1 hydantoinase B/oxoprolinase family protein [Rhodospirillales bacterium]|tara:strand:- start:484 stop:2238 length:1755 start_codon:yes stop_codon:yes gene_type:complete